MLDLYITLGIIGIGIFLFVREAFSVDTTSILIMALFIVSGVLNPEEGFSGFNHPATLTLGCMFVVSAALFKTGMIDSLSGGIVKAARKHYIAALVLFCLMSCTLSAFINDAAVVALLIPLALSVCRETGIAPSRLLIPISFSALFGGTCTLIGTSTNILVSSIALKNGFQPFGMFEFTGPALCLMGIGVFYLFVVSPFLLPERKENNTTNFNHTESYITEIEVLAGSKDIGNTIRQSRIMTEYQADIIGIKREGETLTSFDRYTIVHKGDRLKIVVSPTRLTEIKKNDTYKISGINSKVRDADNNRLLFETMVPVDSHLAGNSLRGHRFRNLYNCPVLAIRHREEVIRESVSDVVIKEGDMLLIYASREEMNELVQRRIVILLSEYKPVVVDYKKAIPALLIALGVVSFAAFNVAPILITAMVGALLLVTMSIMKPKEAYEAIDWKVIFMMAGVLSMGTALQKTGGALVISEFVFKYLGVMDPRVTLSLVFLITFLSTNVLSSKATAALMTPIVLNLAGTMQVSEKPFLIAVMFACSLTFMTPMSYPVNTMVYAPGNYRFNDFLKIGTPLNLIIWIAASFIIPWFFPFK